MKLLFPYKCDYCETIQGATNHWRLRMQDGPNFLMTPWRDGNADLPGVEHICGQECAAKALAKWMADKG